MQQNVHKNQKCFFQNVGPLNLSALFEQRTVETLLNPGLALIKRTTTREGSDAEMEGKKTRRASRAAAAAGQVAVNCTSDVVVRGKQAASERCDSAAFTKLPYCDCDC